MVNCERCIRTFRREHRIRDHESRTRGRLAGHAQAAFHSDPQGVQPPDEGWLDLDRTAVVEVTSEEKEYPVESALVSGEMRGWRAADSGTQTLRLIFDEPQRPHASRSSSKKPRRSVPKSLSCDGLGMADTRFEKLCVSSVILALLIRYVRSRNIKLTSRVSWFLN
jgi:hypothetical protein